MPERIVLDPAAVAVGRTELDISDWVGAAAGVDWGDAEITAYMAEGQRGSTPVDYRVPNRTITIPLVVKARGSVTFAQARERLQAKVALIQAEGGWLKRTTAAGGVVYCDLVNATLKLGGGWMQAHRDADPEGNLVLEAIPDFYGDEAAATETTVAAANSYTLPLPGIDGNYPARCRIVMTNNDSDEDTLTLLWGVRSLEQAATETEVLELWGNAMAPGGALEIAPVTHVVGATWTTTDRLTPVGGVPGPLTHYGTYRVWAQVGAPNNAIDVRLLWDVGDLTLPVINEPVRAEVGAWMIDLGEVRLDRAPVGEHQWTGVIQGRGVTYPGTPPHQLIVYAVQLVPVDAGYGVLRGLPPSAEEGLSPLVASADFDTTAGSDVVVTGTAADLGGNWAATGDPDDFTWSASLDVATRGHISDASGVGRTIYLATDYSRVAVQVDRKVNAYGAPAWGGVAARVSGADRVLAIVGQTSASVTQAYVEMKIGGATTILLNTTNISAVAADTWMTVKLMVDRTGVWEMWVGSAGTGMVLVGSGYRSELATGGTRATGRVGIYDEHTAATPLVTRSYNDFRAWVPQPDAVAYSGGGELELRTDGAWRTAATSASGGVYAPVSHVQGDLPRLPPAGLEGRVTELYLNPSVSDGSTVRDDRFGRATAIDVFYRPCWLFLTDVP